MVETSSGVDQHRSMKTSRGCVGVTSTSRLDALLACTGHVLGQPMRQCTFVPDHPAIRVATLGAVTSTPPQARKRVGD